MNSVGDRTVISIRGKKIVRVESTRRWVTALRWRVPHGIAVEVRCVVSRHALSFGLVSSEGRGWRRPWDFSSWNYAKSSAVELCGRRILENSERRSKYVRWNGVFIYRTVESVRRRSHRLVTRPYDHTVMAILCCAEVPSYVLRVATVTSFFQFSPARRSWPSLSPFFSPSSCPPLPLSPSVRCITNGRGENFEDRGRGRMSVSFSRSFRSYIPREEARRSS